MTRGCSVGARRPQPSGEMIWLDAIAPSGRLRSDDRSVPQSAQERRPGQELEPVAFGGDRILGDEKETLRHALFFQREEPFRVSQRGFPRRLDLDGDASADEEVDCVAVRRAPEMKALAGACMTPTSKNHEG